VLDKPPHISDPTHPLWLLRALRDDCQKQIDLAKEVLPRAAMLESAQGHIVRRFVDDCRIRMMLQKTKLFYIGNDLASNISDLETMRDAPPSMLRLPFQSMILSFGGPVSVPKKLGHWLDIDGVSLATECGGKSPLVGDVVGLFIAAETELIRKQLIPHITWLESCARVTYTHRDVDRVYFCPIRRVLRSANLPLKTGTTAYYLEPDVWMGIRNGEAVIAPKDIDFPVGLHPEEAGTIFGWMLNFLCAISAESIDRKTIQIGAQSNFKPRDCSRPGEPSTFISISCGQRHTIYGSSESSGRKLGVRHSVRGHWKHRYYCCSCGMNNAVINFHTSEKCKKCDQTLKFADAKHKAFWQQSFDRGPLDGNVIEKVYKLNAG